MAMKSVKSLAPHPERKTNRKTPAFSYWEHTQTSAFSGNPDRVPDVDRDPRTRCCFGGKVFVDALKALISRMLLICHSLLVIWRAQLVTGQALWALSVISLLLLVESVTLLIHRSGKDWKWFVWQFKKKKTVFMAMWGM